MKKSKPQEKKMPKPSRKPKKMTGKCIEDDYGHLPIR